MKTKLILSLIVSTLVLAACGGQAAQSEPAAAKPIVIPTLTPAPPTDVALPTEAVPPTEAAAPAPTAEAPISADISFTNDVMPILAGSCTECHGGKQTKAGLEMTTYDGLMAGSFDGVVILAGNSADSLLVQLVTEGKMPKRGPKLSPEQIKNISEWIDAGALNN